MVADLWIHKSGSVYKLITLARCANNPKQYHVVYASTKRSTLRGKQKNERETLPAGTCWVRDSDDFFRKFRPLFK